MSQRVGLLTACVFGGALFVRWLASAGEVLGDESFYLYLARTFGREPAAAVDHAWFHVLNRPLYYAIFHLSTYAGFTSFRWFACVVSACVVALVFWMARRLGASLASALSVSVLLAVERPVVEYAARGFPDPLASGFALAAVWAALLQRPAATFALALACVLCKESFIAVPFIATCVRLIPTAPTAPTARTQLRLRFDAWAWLSVLLPTAYVLSTTLLGATQGVAMQGWAHTPLSWKHARGMWVGPELWPLLLLLVWKARWQWLIIWLGLPAFYGLWSWGLGRGISPWYVTGPATLAALVVAPTLDLAANEARERWGERRSQLVHVALVLCLLPVAVSGVLRMGAQLSDLPHGLPKVQAAPEVVAVLEQVRPERVLLVNCFWSFGYSHLRGEREPASRAHWPADSEFSSLIDRARASQVTIMCRTDETRSRSEEQRLAAAGFETLLVNRDYWVIRSP